MIMGTVTATHSSLSRVPSTSGAQSTVKQRWEKRRITAIATDQDRLILTESANTKESVRIGGTLHVRLVPSMDMRWYQVCLLSVLLGCLPALPERDTAPSAVLLPCNALEFDGVEEYVVVEHSDSLSLNTSDFTIEMWVQMLQTDLEVTDMGHLLTKQSGTNFLWLGYSPAPSGWQPRTTWSNNESDSPTDW